MTVPWGCPNIPLEAGPGLKKIYHSAQWQLIIVNCTLDQVIPAALHPRNFVSQCPPTVNKLSWSYRKLHQRQSNALGTPLTGTKPCPQPFQWSCQYRTIPNRIFSKLCLEFSSSVLKTDRFLFVVKLGFVNCLKMQHCYFKISKAKYLLFWHFLIWKVLEVYFYLCLFFSWIKLILMHFQQFLSPCNKSLSNSTHSSKL